MTMASAPGKAILFGEHSVVYPGHKAVVGAIGQRNTARARRIDEPFLYIRSNIGIDERCGRRAVERFTDDFYDAHAEGDPDRLRAMNAHDSIPVWAVVGPILRNEPKGIGYKIRIGEDEKGFMKRIGDKIFNRPPDEVPVGRSLGSSSATFAAVAGAVTHEAGRYNPRLVERFTEYGDSVVVGNPSGVDGAVATRGGALVYTKNGVTGPGDTETLDTEGVELAVVDTGDSPDTGEMVAHVRRQVDDDPEKLERLREINYLTERGISSLESSNLEDVGYQMRRNHEILREFELSTPEMEELRKVAYDAGAHGSKLTGGGGGGCLIALADNPGKVAKKWRKEGYPAWSTTWGMEEGVRIEPTE